MVRFIHTADWQSGKPFARIEDNDKRALLRNERTEVVRRIGRLAGEQKADFVLVAGDLFDSTTPDKSTVSAVCSVVGSMGLPVLVIPGNHDHAGPGCIWEQEFFLQEQQALAGNLRVLLTPDPVEQNGVVILPCPLTRRQQADDATAWLRDPALLARLGNDRPRVVLAHGSVHGFSSAADDEETSAQPNIIDLERLDADAFDYVALGDWHGAKEISGKVWYSGTPELDRFVKGGEHDPGNVLLVDLPGRGQSPQIARHRTARLNWLEEEVVLTGRESLVFLTSRLEEVLGTRAQTDLLKLTLRGQTDFEGDAEIQRLLDSLRARLLRLKLDNSVQVVPSEDEIRALTQRPGDPLIAALATQLVQDAAKGEKDPAVVRQAMRELFVIVAGQSEKARAC